MKYIIFGTGRSARMGYSKLKDKFEIVAFADNNSDKQGKELLGKKILKPSEISKTDNEVIICSAYYNEIKEQLDELGIRCNLYVSPKSHLLMTFNREEIYNRKPDIKKVLFVAFCECIRPRKIAELLKERGIQVDFAYAKDVCESLKYYKDSYNNLINVNNLT